MISESIAFVQQQPWIQNKTIKDNILFGLPYDEERFKATIRACQLKRDLEILPGGDQTEIGEKGINLSGGQKARVSLARAVYSNRDLILMDDPISALDANVKKKIFKHVFMQEFKHKTRVLVTHAIDFLHLVDSIILMKDGQVVFHGPYHEVKENPYLKELVRIHKGHETELKQANFEGLVEESKDDLVPEAELDVASDSETTSAEGSEPEIEEVDDLPDPKLRDKTGRTKKANVYSIDMGN